MEYKSFASLGRFIPMYFILLFAKVNGIVFLIYLSYLSLLMYRNARHFCVLILYPATLPNSLISSKCFLVASLGFSLIVSCQLQKVTILLLLFQFGSLLFLFFSVIAVATTSKTTLNNSGEREHTCLVPDLRGNVFKFSPLR